MIYLNSLRHLQLLVIGGIITLCFLFGCEKKDGEVTQKNSLKGESIKAILLQEISNTSRIENHRFLILGSEVCASCQSNPIYESVLQCQAQVQQKITILGVGIDSVTMRKNNILYRGLLNFVYADKLSQKLFEADSSLAKNLVCAIKVDSIGRSISTLDHQIYPHNGYTYSAKVLDAALVFLSYP
jgi:hypothetical protein